MGWELHYTLYLVDELFYLLAVIQGSVVQNCMIALNLKLKQAVCWKSDQEWGLSENNLFAGLV